MFMEFSGESVPLSCNLGSEGSKWLCIRHQRLLPLEYICALVLIHAVWVEGIGSCITVPSITNC